MPGAYLTDIASDRDAARVTLFVLLMTLILNLVAARSDIVLYLDGAYYLLRIIDAGGFFLEEPTSRAMQILQQLPLVIAHNAGVDNPIVMRALAGASNLLLPWTLTAACWWVLPRDSKALMAFPLIAYLGGSLASWFPTVTDAPPAAAYFWLLLFLVLFRGQTRVSLVLVLLVSLPVFRSHEAMVFLAPLLAVAALWRGLQCRDQNAIWMWFILALIFAAAAGLQIGAILDPRDVSNRDGFVAQLLSGRWLYWQGWNTTAILVLGLGMAWGVSGLGAAIPDRFYRRRWDERLVMGSLAIGGIITVVVIAATMVLPTLYGFQTQFAARAHSALLSLVLGVLAVLVVIRPSTRRPLVNQAQWATVLLLCVGVVGTHSVGLAHWRGYIADFNKLLAEGRGYISYEQAVAQLPPRSAERFRHLSGGWTHPTMSVLLADSGDVSTVVANPAGIAWEPFDLCAPRSWPASGFDLTEYREALKETACPPRRYERR